jgi:hypothetical protein
MKVLHTKEKFILSDKIVWLRLHSPEVRNAVSSHGRRQKDKGAYQYLHHTSFTEDLFPLRRRKTLRCKHT